MIASFRSKPLHQLSGEFTSHSSIHGCIKNLWRPVVTSPKEPEWTGAPRPTNNTAKVRAINHAVTWILLQDGPDRLSYNLLTNSELCVLLFADKKTNAVCKKKLIMKFWKSSKRVCRKNCKPIQLRPLPLRRPAMWGGRSCLAERCFTGFSARVLWVVAALPERSQTPCDAY